MTAKTNIGILGVCLVVLAVILGKQKNPDYKRYRTKVGIAGFALLAITMLLDRFSQVSGAYSRYGLLGAVTQATVPDIYRAVTPY